MTLGHSTPITSWTTSVALLCLLSASAVAQDYADNPVAGQYLSPPGTATNLLLGENSNKKVDLPFSFPFFGGSYDEIYVHDNGFLQIAPAVVPSGSPSGNSAFPSSSNANDGMVAPCWDTLQMRSGAAVFHWTDGTAPNRRFVVAWVDMYRGQFFFTTYRISAQVHLYEGTGRIVFAYAGSGNSWNQMSYSTGIEAPGLSDTRSVSPAGRTSNNLSGSPTHYEFLPDVTTVSGRVVADKLIADATGVGNTVQAAIPLAGLPLEILSGNGSVAAGLTTDANGSFSRTFLAIDGNGTGTVRIVAKTPRCTVRRTPTGNPVAYVLEDALVFGAETAMGTVLLDDLSDPDGDFRGPWNITRVVEAAHAWASPRTADPVPALDALYDPTSTEASRYTPPGVGVALMRVAGPGTADPDLWDDDVVTRLFGEHVLHAISLEATTGVTPNFDLRSTEGGAFTEAFSYYVASLIQDSPKLVDTVDGWTATVVDLEDPQPSSPKGADVTAWVLAALHDLADGANEPHDAEDGTTLSGERPFAVVDRIDGAVDAQTFYDAWGDQGFAGSALSRIFIHHGLIADDGSEPNDSAAEATVLGPVGLRSAGHVLSRYNEDWFEVELPDPTDELTVEVVYDRVAIPATLELQILSSTGSVVATGQPDGDDGAVRAVTGSVSPGIYRVRVSHATGGRIDEYAVTAFAELELLATRFPDWTRDRPYEHLVTPRGGIAPFELRPNPGFPLPLGMIVGEDPLRVHGASTETGRILFELVLSDSADPPNAATFSQEFVISEPLAFAGSPFVGLSQGTPSTARLGFSGGTPPLDTAVGSGTLPGGISLRLDPPRFDGTTSELVSRVIRVDSVDVAGSATSAATTLVTCVAVPVKKSPTPLAAGDAACGFYLDALGGSSIGIKVGTSKRRAKRQLQPLLIDSDGRVVAGGSLKGGNGRASVKKVVAPATGRYFVILASPGGEETELVGTTKVKVGKTGKGGLADFAPGESFSVEIGGFAGTRFTLKGRTDKAAANEVIFVGLLGPNGETLAAGDLDVRVKGHKFTVTGTLTSPGTWTARINAQAGRRGSFSYSFKLKHPKRAVFGVE